LDGSAPCSDEGLVGLFKLLICVFGFLWTVEKKCMSTKTNNWTVLSLYLILSYFRLSG
jgi:hypothetical protein